MSSAVLPTTSRRIPATTFHPAFLWALSFFFAAGCAHTALPPAAPSILSTGETRRFEGISERKMLSACTDAWQDLGFIIEDGDGKPGTFVATKERRITFTPEDAKCLVGSAAVAVGCLTLLGMAGPFALIELLTLTPPSADHDSPDREVIQALLTVERDATQPASSVTVKTSLQRIVYTRNYRVHVREPLNDPTLGAAFFAALAKSIGRDKNPIDGRTVMGAGTAGQAWAYQTRSFNTPDQEAAMRAVLATLVELGFFIDKADAAWGLVIATKRDGLTVRATVTVGLWRERETVVRVSAQSIARGEVGAGRVLDSPSTYQVFFNALATNLALDAHPLN